MKTLPCLKSFLAISLFLGLSSLSFAQNNESAVPSDPTTSQTEEVDAALTPPPEEETPTLDSGNTAWMITATAWSSL